MDTGKRIAIGFSALLVIGIGVRVYLIHRERVQADRPAVVKDTRPQLTNDQLAIRRRLEPVNMEGAKVLIGKPVWVAIGGQLDYYPYSGHRADYAHSAGVLLALDELEVKDLVTQVAPKSAATRIPHGDKQVLLVFTEGDSPKEYAVPVGYVDGPEYKFLLDDIFFYDDPHTIYANWPAKVWAAIEAHRAEPGMNELQTGLALGQVMTTDSTDVGNRIIHYANNGHPIDVTFVNDKATEVKPAAQ